MATPGDPTLDPSSLAARSFNTAFRGYDPAEVREYLSALAEALRARERETKQADDAAVAELEAQLADARSATATAQADLERADTVRRSLESRVAELEARPDPEPVVVPAPEPSAVDLDEATVAKFLGEETTRVLAAAKSAAADIVAKAEAEAARRTTEIDEAQSKANREIGEQREAAQEEAAQLIASANAEAEETTAAADRKAEEQRAAIVSEIEQATEAQRLQAEKAAADGEAAAIAATARAEGIVAEAETEAARMRAEAEADVLASQESSKETTRAMVSEAQAVREKVLEDLVVRRRMGRQQLDQAKAARDRLARALLTVRKEVDSTLAGLDNAVPEARAAMEAVAQADTDAADAQAVRDLAIELDNAALAGNPLTGERPLTVASGAAALDLEASTDPTTSEGDNDDAAADDGSVGDDSSDHDSSDHDSTDHDSSDHDSTDEVFTGESGDAPGDDVDEADEARGSVDDLFARIREDDADEATSDDVADDDLANDAMASAAMAAAASADDSDDSDSGGDSDSGADSDSGTESDNVNGTDADDEAAIEVPSAFVDRDLAMTRHGAELRRKLKRTMADDQSDVLDRLRRAKKMSVTDLLPAEEQHELYVAAVTPSIQAAADAGAALTGGSVGAKEVDQLIARVISNLVAPLRQRIEQSVGDSADADEVLEPIRAHYREARSTELPALADDVLAEAFAVGAYAGIASGAELRWVADPRFEPGADCFDNTLATGVSKPDAFPTGRNLPGAEPGCRCLVLPAD